MESSPSFLKKKLEEALKEVENQRKRADKEKKRADKEKKRAEVEKKRTEVEKQRAKFVEEKYESLMEKMQNLEVETEFRNLSENLFKLATVSHRSKLRHIAEYFYRKKTFNFGTKEQNKLSQTEWDETKKVGLSALKFHRTLQNSSSTMEHENHSVSRIFHPLLVYAAKQAKVNLYAECYDGRMTQKLNQPSNAGTSDPDFFVYTHDRFPQRKPIPDLEKLKSNLSAGLAISSWLRYLIQAKFSGIYPPPVIVERTSLVDAGATLIGDSKWTIDGSALDKMSSYAAGLAHEMGWKGKQDFLFFGFLLTPNQIALCEIKIKYQKKGKLRFENEYETLPIPKNVYEKNKPPLFLSKLKEFFVKYQISNLKNACLRYGSWSDGIFIFQLGQTCAKVATCAESSKYLTREKEVLEILNSHESSKHIPKIMKFGKNSIWSIPTFENKMTLLTRPFGIPISDIDPEQRKHLAGWITKGIRCALNLTHKIGFVHADICPSNVILSYCGKENNYSKQLKEIEMIPLEVRGDVIYIMENYNIVLIDFDLAKKIGTKRADEFITHRKYSFFGKPRFASISNLCGFFHKYPIDDLETLCYLHAYLFNQGKVSWDSSLETLNENALLKLKFLEKSSIQSLVFLSGTELYQIQKNARQSYINRKFDASMLPGSCLIQKFYQNGQTLNFDFNSNDSAQNLQKFIFIIGITKNYIHH